MSPREASISLSRVKVTAWPHWAWSRLCSNKIISATFAFAPLGSTRTSSPGLTVPAAIVPAKPLKLRWGRFTHCTGKRRPWSLARLGMGAVSSMAMSVGPRNHDMCGERFTTLSPLRADMGMGVMVENFNWLANDSKSAWIWWNTLSL